MKLELGVSTKQSQSLVITPQMQQALKLLQLSNIELNNYLTEEVEKNPLLELNNDQNENQDNKEKNEKEEINESNTEKINENTFQENTSSSLSSNNIDQNTYESRQETIEDWDSNDFSDGEEINHTQTIAEQTLTEIESLSIFLEKQIRLERINHNIRNISIALLGWIDDNGWLKETDEELSDALGVNTEQIIKARELIKTLEPLGVGGKDFIECIRIQLSSNNILDDKLSKFLDNLSMIEKGEISKLMRICNIDKPEFLLMMNKIKSCEPRPGLKFTIVIPEKKEPDLIVEKDSNGWNIEINENTLPKMLFLDRYWEELAKQNMKNDDKKYLKECHRSGKWLKQALQHRTATMKRVGNAILKKQISFFEYGIESLIPMTMKDIANDIEVHESTISRVVSNKLLYCPRGTFDLKFFFSQGLKSSSGNADLSSSSVKNEIQKIINGETPGKPISDTKITTILCDRGITIARRTVAKYRENLGIPPASARRIQHQLVSN